MKSLFLPAIVLMNRLGYTRKFMLLALMSMVAFSVVAYSLFAHLNKEINILQRELEGIGLVGQVPKVVQLIQQHRGLSAGALSGIETMRGKRAIKEQEVVNAFQEMEGKLPASLIAGDDWRNIKANWQHVREKGLDLTQEECFAIHTSLIGQILFFGVAVADEYALTLDPELDSYYLIDTVVNKLPQVIEYLAQIRASGLIALADRRIAGQEKMAIGARIGKLGDAFKAFEINVEKAARYNPAKQSIILGASQNIADAAHQVVSLAEADILTGRFAISPEDFYVTTSVAINDGYVQMHESLLSVTEALLKSRATEAENMLRISIGIAILLLLMVVYFSIGIYHSIIDSVRSLGRSAHAFADGDIRERVRLDTSDELGQIGDSFNKMAEGFSAMLVARKQAEESLQKSLFEQKEINQKLENAQRREVEAFDELRVMMDTLGEGFWKADATGRIIETNDAYCRLVGYSRDEVIGAHISKFEALEQTPEIVAAHIQQIIEHRHARFETKHRHRDGRLIDIEVATTFIPEKQCFIVFLHDITERKRARKAILESEIKYKRLHESMMDAFVMVDMSGRLIDSNSTYQEILGYSFEELQRLTYVDLTPQKWHEFEAKIVTEQIIPHGRSQVYEKEYIRKDGTVFPVELKTFLIRNENNQPEAMWAIVRDITERKEAEEKLRRHNEELGEINRQLNDMRSQLLQSEKMSSIGQLAAGVAHEINNPIGYVHSNLGTLEKYVWDAFGMIDLYEQEKGAITDPEVHARLSAARVKLDIAFLKEDLRALMSESKDGIARVKKIVQDLKDFSHMDTSDEWHFADLRKGLDSTLNIVNNEIKYKADVVREYGDIPEVECLSSQINQVFMNLLVNAAHAIEERGTITIRTGQQGKEVWVEVADTGKGIAPEHLKKIFDPFFTTKPVGKGTGLGLSLSYGIIQKHHGRIEVNSEVGKGASFKVWLPVSQAKDENTPQNA